jgi:hypothetical protein
MRRRPPPTRSLREARLCAAALSLTIILPMGSCAAESPGSSPEPSGSRSEPSVPPEGSPPSWPGPDSLASAVAATRAIASAHMELQTTVDGPGAPLTLVHRGGFDRRGDRAQAESDMSQAAAALEAAGQQLGGDWSQPTRIVVDGDIVYSQLGPMADALGRAPTDWTSVPIVAILGRGVDDNDTLALVLDPLGPLDLLERPVTEIASVGDENVRGTPAVHLRASLDLVRSGDGMADKPASSSFEGRLVAAGVAALPVDVWVDAERVVRRMEISLGAGPAGGPGATALTTTFEVYDVGAAIEIEVPGPDEVMPR